MGMGFKCRNTGCMMDTGKMISAMEKEDLNIIKVKFMRVRG